MTARIRPTMADYADAERYRWLRAHPTIVLRMGEEWCGYATTDQVLPTINGTDLDLIVDTMRQLEPTAPTVEEKTE